MAMTDMGNHVVRKIIGEAREEGECKGIKATNVMACGEQLIIKMVKQGPNWNQ